MTVRPAEFGEEVRVVSNGANWLVTCHPADAVPEGTPHGANAWCVTTNRDIVLVSADGDRFGWPGGRPESGEEWEDTLRREIAEEARALVRRARCLGFTRGRCLEGSGWRAVRVAIGDAALVYMPLSPRLAICLTTSREEAIIGDIPPSGVQRMNHLMWRNTDRFIVARPGADLNRSLVTIGRGFTSGNRSG